MYHATPPVVASQVLSAGQVRRGFTLVELLVVIGIIALLIGMLLPALTRVQAQAKSVVCQSNLRQVGIVLNIYSDNQRGWIYPVADWNPVRNQYDALGANRYPWERWPAQAFKFVAPEPPAGPLNPSKIFYDATPWMPPVLRCPADDEPASAHSYVLNKHLARSPEERVKLSSKIRGGRPHSEVVLMGEKTTLEHDYYMDGYRVVGNTGSNDYRSDFNRVVDLYKHGVRLGSNYLFLDGHVAVTAPSEVLAGIDPWDLVAVP